MGENFTKKGKNGEREREIERWSNLIATKRLPWPIREDSGS
jgi:hypothetical protein